MARLLTSFGLALFALLALAAAPARVQPPVWVVHGPHATVVMFGSVHLLPGDVDWEPGTLKEALAHADELWFEIPIDKSSALSAQQAAIRLGVLPNGQTLSAELSPEDRVRLAEAAKTCNLPLPLLDRLRPWYADLALSVSSFKLANANSDDGVEQKLAAAVPNIPKHAFETIEEQINFLAGGSDKDQIDSLRETFDEVKEGPVFYRKLVNAWLSGDTKAIERQALEPMKRKAPGDYKTLLVDRNKRWVPVIEQRLAGQGEAVMVVGAGHLIGPDSVIARLRADGYRVDGP
jgi:uncharacterized protein YbaP (TraB family)